MVTVSLDRSICSIFPIRSNALEKSTNKNITKIVNIKQIFFLENRLICLKTKFKKKSWVNYGLTSSQICY